MSEHTTALCCTILKDHFGPKITQIASVLMTKGRQTLSQLSKQTQMTTKRIKPLLFIMLQQNIVSFSEHEEGLKILTYYELSIKDVLLRSRFAAMRETVGLHFDEHCVEITELLLLHGRLTPQQAQKMVKMDQLTFANAFHTLIDGKVLIPVTLQDAITEMDQEIKAVEEAVQASFDSNKAPLSSLEKTKITKQLDVKMTDLPQSAFRINLNAFVLVFRNQKIKELAEKMINPEAGELMSAILQTVSTTSVLGEETSAPLHMSMLMQRFHHLELPVSGTKGLGLVHYLNLLAKTEPPILFESASGEYRVQTKKLVQELRARLILSIIHEALSVSGTRIWRLLRSMKKLEEKQISKIALMEEKTTRHCLYEMLKMGFVFLQDVPKSQDHSATRTTFLWFVDIQKSSQILLNNAYKIINNLRIRKQHEYATRTILLQKLQRSDVVSGETPLSEADLEQKLVFDKLLQALNTAEIQMEEQVMLLRDL
ncbi:hypothetical protein EDD86DRAFT_190607 [Gorgonomyces haynaldii]|nr:hypothetical protein EDD86DRAFT_190607 [Gorgonomyces haynaldii]